MYLSAPFILQNFFKKILDLIQSFENKRHFYDHYYYYHKIITIILIYLLARFILQSF